MAQEMDMDEDVEPSLFAKPVPRRPKSPATLTRLRVQSRRLEYFRLHGATYLKSLDHELADPILYERLVKKFQTPAEREAEGKAKGYGRTLEADLVRGETRLSQARQSEAGGPQDTELAGGCRSVADAWDGPVETKAHGLELWQAFLIDRFVRGGDDDFDYALVDGNDEYDEEGRRAEEDAWFEGEEPSWADGEDSPGAEPERELYGETGVQDF